MSFNIEIHYFFHSYFMNKLIRGNIVTILITNRINNNETKLRNFLSESNNFFFQIVRD